MRPDAHRFIRPDWRRFVNAGSELEALVEDIERKYRSDQPRVPAGSPEGGQWTGGSRTSGNTVQTAGAVIYVCIAGSHGRWTAGGMKGYSVTYECTGGRSFTRSGPGHYFPMIVIDPFR